jgi:catechol 2,3-dioxygenase-like lactoylglutathione lyase family enzyme
MSFQHPPVLDPRSFFASMRGHHVAVRVPDFEAEKRFFVEKLDFRVVHEWPYADQQLAYLAPPNDDHFYIEILGGGTPGPIAKASYEDLGDSLRYAGLHHACLQVDDVDATVAELRRRGVSIVTEPFDLPVIQRRLAFFADPYGNLFELAEVQSSARSG